MREFGDWPRGPFGGLRARGWNPAAYMVDGILPSLVLDFTTPTFASDLSGWAEIYAADGTRPTMVLDFVEQEYGA